MLDMQEIFTLTIFVITVLLIVWRPLGINESIPTAIGAGILLLFGIVPLGDVYRIFGIVSGAAITILSTIVMSMILESVGFFRWTAFNLVSKANGSGIKLFWYINLLCFLMTLFFNNNVSILITTPIIIETLSLLKLRRNQIIPYLLSGALIATGSSATIGVSNLANLIALKIVGLDLNSYVSMMFLPSMIGLGSIALLLYYYFKNDIPQKVAYVPKEAIERMTLQPSYGNRHLPLSSVEKDQSSIDWPMFLICITIVVLIRASFFALAPLGIPTEWPAIVGVLLLIAVRWYFKRIGMNDIIRNTPWHIILFAFGLYVVVYGLKNSGLISSIVDRLSEPIAFNNLNAIFIMGILSAVMSNLCINLPSVIIGALSLTVMGLNVHSLQVAYLAIIIGGNIGSLLLPMGNIASLFWIFNLRKNNIHVSWREYFKATILVIPFSLFISLISLYVWTEWL